MNEYSTNRQVIVNIMHVPLGFLYTGKGPDDIHGNMGLLDQVEAMRWVNKYIHCFGGDKDNVTIAGESAGQLHTFNSGIMSTLKGYTQRFLSIPGACAPQQDIML